jgi:aminoglycoside phosphotransferase (APT) family kinase protein
VIERLREPDHDHRLLREIAARVLPGSGESSIARATSGASTPVYRITRGGNTYYLRLAEGPEASLAPEVWVHDRLHASGVRVPEVVHFEPFHHGLQRSVMVTTAIPGRSLAEDHGRDAGAVLAAAGRDLALINDVVVTGFGFVRRDHPPGTHLAGEYPTLPAFALGSLEEHLVAAASILTDDEIAAVRTEVARHDGWLEAEQASLAHGDLDATHIYHQDGQYTGIIDFGEIRGADRFYDLGHAALHEREVLPYAMLPDLLAGYAEVSPLPADHAVRIAFWSLLIGVRALARASHRPRAAYRHHLTRAVREALAALAT